MINKSSAKKLSSRNILGSKSKISGTLNLTENLQEKDLYMDSIVCKAATTTNIELDGSIMTIDDVVLANNDLVLIKDQTDKTLNGVYYALNSGFLRYDTIRTPTTVSVELGTINKELLFYQITANYILGGSEIIYLKIETETLPAGTINQILRHNGTDWVVANYTTLTDTATSSKLAIVNGTSPTLKKAELYVDDSNSALILQIDPSAPSGGQSIQAYTSTTAQAIYIQHEGNEFISIYSSTSSKYISMRGGTTGEQVVIEAKKTPATTNKNIVVRNDTVDNFFVQNNGKVFTKQHPQIDTTEAATGKVLVCTDADGNSQWQTITTGDGHTHSNKDLLDHITDEGDGDLFLSDDGTYKEVDLKRGLVLQTSDLNLTISTENIIYPVLQFSALANKKYKLEYLVTIRGLTGSYNTNMNFQIKVGDGTGSETCKGFLHFADVYSYSSCIYNNDTNQCFVDLLDTDYIPIGYRGGYDFIVKIEGILQMNTDNENVVLNLITKAEPTPPANMPYLLTGSWLKYEMFD